MQFILLEPLEFILLAIEFYLKSARFLTMPRRGRYYIHVKTGHWILFEICCEKYILRQFEIIIICMPLLCGQSMLRSGQKLKKKNEIIQSFARFLPMPASYYYWIKKQFNKDIKKN